MGTMREQLKEKLLSQAEADPQAVFPGIENAYLETRGFTSLASTRAVNVLSCRMKARLANDSVDQGFDQVFVDVKREFPGVEDADAALQMRRWKRDKDRREARRRS